MDIQANMREITLQDIQEMMKAFRRSQTYIEEMEDGPEKEDLSFVTWLGADLIMDLAAQKGFETLEDLYTLENGKIITLLLKRKGGRKC